MRAFGRWGRVLLVGSMVACGDDGVPGGPGEDVADIVEAPLEHNLGPQRAMAWTARHSEGAEEGWWALTPLSDGYAHLVTGKVDLARFAPGVADDDVPVWKTRIPLFPDDAPIYIPSLIPALDDGVFYVGRVGVQDIEEQVLGVIAFAPDGAVRWQITIPEVGIYENPRYLPLPTGGLAIAFYAPMTRSPRVVVLGPDGVERTRTVIPELFLQSADDAPGLDSGVGHPLIVAMTAAPDGGVIAAGHYVFYRSIECGSRDEPIDPVYTNCGDSDRVGFLARLDGSGQLQWVRRLGDPWIRGILELEHVALLPDGEIVAAGHRTIERTEPDPHVHALATRWSASGELLWSKSYPYGGLPGATFFEFTKFIGLVPHADGSVDAILRPPNGLPFRVVRLDPDATISRVQILDDLIDVTLTAARVWGEVRTDGGQIGWRRGNRAPWMLAELAPDE